MEEFHTKLKGLGDATKELKKALERESLVSAIKGERDSQDKTFEVIRDLAKEFGSFAEDVGKLKSGADEDEEDAHKLIGRLQGIRPTNFTRHQWSFQVSGK